MVDGFRVYHGNEFDPKAHYRIVGCEWDDAREGEETPEPEQSDLRQETTSQWRIENACDSIPVSRSNSLPIPTSTRLP